MDEPPAPPADPAENTGDDAGDQAETGLDTGAAAGVTPAMADRSAEAPADPRDVMPGWVPRAILLFLVGAAGLVTVRWLLLELQSFLVLLVVSLFLSFALEPAVNWLNRHGIRRGLATGMVMLGSLVAMLAFLVLLGQALFSPSGAVIGTSVIGIDMADQLATLKTQIRSMKIGETGYYYMVDATPGPHRKRVRRGWRRWWSCRRRPWSESWCSSGSAWS